MVVNTSSLSNTNLVVPPATVPEDSYLTNMVRSSVPSAATVLITFATTSEVTPVSVFPTKSALKFSIVCATERSEVNVA